MKTTFIYKKINNCAIKGDFYPTNKKQAPLLVYIHGGGLVWGKRTDINKEQIDSYCQAGFNVCSIDYRLTPETKLPEITKDIQDALIWLKEKGTKRYDFDPGKIAVVGSSAGAYLALLSGTFKHKPKAIVSFYGYGDILADFYMKPATHFSNRTSVSQTLATKLIQTKAISNAPIEKRYAIYLHYRQQGTWVRNATGLDPVFDIKRIQAYCPIDNIDVNYPPTLLLHGVNDTDVPYGESMKMSKALTKLGVKNKFITIPNQGHLFDQDMQSPDAKKAIKQVIAFLNINL